MTTPTEKLAADFESWALDAEKHSQEMVPVHRSTLRKLAYLLRSQRPGQDERTPADYAIEHGEYLACDAEAMIEKVNALAEAELRREESDDDDGDVEDARGDVTEALRSLRNAVYEFRKRAERAKASHLSAPQMAPHFHGIGSRKLADLQAQGYGITGYAIRHETTGLRGAIDGHGFVYWWHPTPPTPAGEAGGGNG